MSNEIAENKTALPAHLQGGKKAHLGNIDRSDLIMPRLKLLAAVSPECEEFEAAKPGMFWHSIAAEPLPKPLRMIPIVIRKSYILWAPRGDARGILARSNDAIHWDVQDSFKVKLKGVAKEQIWTTADTVAKSGLAEFGSSVHGDPNSQPAASLTYNILAYLPDHPDLSPVVLINTRSSVKKAKLLISKIEMRPYEHYDQVFAMGSVSETNPNGEQYYNFVYTADGYTTAEEHEITAALYDRFKEADFKAADESDEVAEPGSTAQGDVGGKSGKF
jgi:hypothetical protein